MIDAFIAADTAPTQALCDVYRLLRARGLDPDIYAVETIRYWLAQGYSPARLLTEILLGEMSDQPGPEPQ